VTEKKTARFEMLLTPSDRAWLRREARARRRSEISIVREALVEWLRRYSVEDEPEGAISP
jgi:hypothetical protein